MNSTALLPRSKDIFKRIKEIPFPEVQAAFHGAEPRLNKISCPFHDERTPSFHIYPAGWKCFGCNLGGDSVTFVMMLLGLSPLDAAREIARRFDIPVRDKPLSKEEQLRIAQEKALQQRKQHLSEAFEDWCREAQKRARVLAEAIRNELDEHGVDVEADILPLVHKLPVFEFWADTLGAGSDDEKLELYRLPELRRWLR